MKYACQRQFRRDGLNCFRCIDSEKRHADEQRCRRGGLDVKYARVTMLSSVWSAVQDG